MATSLNRVTLIGYLGRDPEVKDIPTGRMVGLSVATSESWTDKDGQRQERTEWHRITIYDDLLVNLASERLKRGARVYIEGQLQTRKWTDEEGTDRMFTMVAIPKYGGRLILL
jgi:single-strand DNA-binding protein